MQGPSQCPPISTPSSGSLRVGRMGANQELGPLGVPFLGYFKAAAHPLAQPEWDPWPFLSDRSL